MQIFGGALAVFAKAEICAHGDVFDPQTLGQDLTREIFGGEGGHLGVEGEFKQLLDPQFRQTVGAGFGVHQPKSRGGGREVFARMRLEGDNPQGAMRAGKINHRLMAKVDAIKIAHRHRSAARGWVKPLPMLVDLHLTP